MGRAVQLSLSILLFAASVWAQAADLFVWRPYPDAPRVLLGVPEGKSREEVLAQQSHHWKLPQGTTEDLPAPGSQPRFIVLANTPLDLDFKDEKSKVPPVIRQLGEAGADPYVLPLLSGKGMPAKEANDFRMKVGRAFDGMLALGGADVAPKFYRQPDLYAHQTNAERDAAEMAFIRRFIAEGRGAMFGICRGHQLCAVSQGHELIQDIPTQTQATLKHTGGHTHGIEIEKDSALAMLLGGGEKTEVNTYHHQAVLPNEDSPLRVVAWSEDHGERVVEAMEFRNGKGMTFQFHPELMDDATGRKLLRGMVQYARIVRDQGSCAGRFEDLVKD